MHVRKIFVIAISLVLIVMLCSCAKKDNNTKQSLENQLVSNETSGDSKLLDKSESKTTVQQQAAVIEIDPPNGWEPEEIRGIDVSYRKGMASFTVKNEGSLGKTLDEITTEVKEAFEGVFSDVKYEGDTTNITVDGKDGRQFVFTGTAYGTKMKYKYVYLIASEKVYAITLGAPPDTFDTLTEDFEKILKDIRFK
ncbi:MAG TPA: hypothetical protein GX527_01410 [Clostridiaceae bacterium]|nr:hypothetical protein [Clostridiaceae bacterium]